MIRELVFTGYDNFADLQLQDDSGGDLANAPTGTVTKVGLLVEGDSYDSGTYATEITWNSSGQISLQLGGLGIEKGDHLAALVLFDATYPNGLRWPVDFTLVVR